MKILDAAQYLIQSYRLRAMQRRGAVVLRDLGGADLPKRALLHYKIEPLLMTFLQKGYRHTNVWECPEIVRILNACGYRVDVVDRSNREWMPEDEYDLLISNASGNSGRMYPAYAERTGKAMKIFYALGPEVSQANARVLERYDYLQKRKDVSVPALRVMENVDIDRCKAVSDAIIVLDDNGYSASTYCAWPQPIFRVSPSSSPLAAFIPAQIEHRNRRHFLAFTGDGFIAKGVDLLVEVFAELPDCQLTIAGPNSDQTFWSIYGDLIKQSPNIRYEGFLAVGGPRFRALASDCAFVVLPPAAEGVCTSITTCMSAGLVPIAPYESGVDVSSINSYLTSNTEDLKDDVRRQVLAGAALDLEAYRAKVMATLAKAQDYSQESFTLSWKRALIGALAATGRLC